MSANKPSQSEEEYFARLEAEKKTKLKEKELQVAKNKEAERLRVLHWMHCPKCGQALKEVVFRGIKIDKCTGCDGVWLDDGELEILTEKEGGVLKKILSGLRSK